MSEKQDLAILFTMLGSPAAAFAASEPFRRLEKEPELIRVIEPLGLPEVNRLICCSAELANQKWAAKYADARKLYASAEPFDVYDLLMEYIRIDEFEEKILRYADRDVLGRISAYFSEISLKRDAVKKERTSLKGKITKKKKKQAAGVLQTGSPESDEIEEQASAESPAVPEKSENELRLEELDKSIDEYEKFFKGFAGHYSAVEAALRHLSDTESLDILREKAFHAIDANEPSAEENFLARYIREGELTEEDIYSFHDYGFLHRLLALFEKDNYRDFAFPVISMLCAAQAINLASEPIAEFIRSHGTMLAGFLKEQYLNDTESLENPDNRLLLEYAIADSLSDNSKYADLWDSVHEASGWKIILDTAENAGLTPLSKTAAGLLFHLNGASMTAFVELIQSDDAEFGITLPEFIIELIARENPQRENLVRDYTRSTEQDARKLRRKLAVKERELNRRGQDLFSALYLPLEQLEELAVNLRLSDGDIACSLVAGHVITALASLREGLSSLGLDAVENIDAWQKQEPVEYDPEKHRLGSVSGVAGEPVKLQTLGYVYTDDDGGQKIRAAEVYTPAPKQNRVETKAAPKKNVPNRKRYPVNKPHPKKKPFSEKQGYPKRKSYAHSGDTDGRTDWASRKGGRK